MTPNKVPGVNLEPPSSRDTSHGSSCDAGGGSSGCVSSAKWHIVDLSHSSAAGAPQEVLCLPGSRAVPSLLVPTAHGTSRGSEFHGSVPGGHQEVLQSPSQLPGKYTPTATSHDLDSAPDKP